MEQLSEEAVVTDSTNSCNEAWLFLLALAWEVEIGSWFELSEKKASVAFNPCKTGRCAAGMANLLAKAAEPGGVTMSLDANGRAAERTAGDEKEEEEDPLDSEARQSLLADLEKALIRQPAGSLSLDTCFLTEGLPKFESLKDRPKVNNHRHDSTSKVDKLLRANNKEFLLF